MAFAKFREEWAMRLRLFLTILVLSCGGCAGSRHYHPLEAGTVVGAPHFIELRHETQVATLHFPAGLYQLEAADDAGYFYRAPSQIREDSSGERFFHNGGLYLKNGRRGNLRGYIYWYSGLVHVGDLSQAEYVFRD